MQKAEQGHAGVTCDARARRSADWRPVRVGTFDVWQSPVLGASCGLAHAFTSVGCNLSLRSGSDAASSRERRRALCVALGLAADRWVCGAQVHCANIAHVDAAIVAGNNGDGGIVVPDTDGLVTRLRGVPLLALSADCPLIVLYDEDAGALGVAHSGWRGTVANMPGALVRALVERCGASADNCVAVISPCAGGHAYEIRDDVYAEVDNATGDAEAYIHRAGATMSLDLPKLIAAQLAIAGIPQAAIHRPQHCTISDPRFYSYRRDGADSGHAGLVVGMV